MICKECLLNKELNEFPKRSDRKTAYRKVCKVCTNLHVAKWRKANPAICSAHTATRLAAKNQRTPRWLTETHKSQIRLFYNSAAELSLEFGHKIEVDHIVPLRGKHVSGLHVPWNLQLLSADDNRAKGRR